MMHSVMKNIDMDLRRWDIPSFLLVWTIVLQAGSCLAWEQGPFQLNTQLPRFCGKTENYNPDTRFVTKGTWPWLGLLFRQDNTVTRCNVVLIHSEVAIAAVTCIGSNNAEELSVQFSTESLPTFQSVLVDRIDFLYQNSPVNNIGLLKLASKVEFNKNVQPICLWEQNNDYSSQLDNHIGMVAGSDLSNSSVRFRIYQSTVSIAGTQTCKTVNRDYFDSILKGSICVLYRESSQCHYIGSTLMMPRLSEEGWVVWYLRGMQTLRIWYCGGGKHTPSFDLAPHRAWIESHFKKSSLQSGCGRRVLSETPLIIAGNETQRGDWPWHVALYNSNSSQSKKYGVYICGGSLITNEIVLTAAHCLTAAGTTVLMPANRMIVLIGKYDLSRKETGTLFADVASLIVHEDFNPVTFVNDIGLMRLEKPVTFSNFIQPACLWDNADVDKRKIFNKYADVPGWGFDENDNVRVRLRLATIPVIDDVTCYQSHETFFVKRLTSKTFCAGTRNTGASVCNGDSGGGLVLPIRQTDQRETYFLRGIVSIAPSQVGKRICDPNHYALFTDVAQYLPWIESHLSSG